MDHVVSDILSVCAGRQLSDLKSIYETGSVKSLIPPARPFDQGGFDWLGRAGVDVVDDRLHGLGSGGIRILFLQPVPGYQPDLQVFVNACTVILNGRSISADARVCQTNPEIVIRQFHQGMMLPERNGVPVRGNAGNQSSGITAGERQ